MKSIAFTRWVCTSLFALALATGVSASTSAAANPNVAAHVVDPRGAVNNGVAEGSFRISVSNGETGDVSDFTVVFSDESSVEIGSIPAGATVVSGRVTATVDMSSMPSANSPLRVTLKFTYNGEAVELPYDLTLARK